MQPDVPQSAQIASEPIRIRRPRLLAFSVIVATIAVATIGMGFWWRTNPPPTGNAFTADEAPLDDGAVTAVENPGYVGMEACAACHADRVAEFRGTNHERTFRVPKPEDMPRGFLPGQGTYLTGEPGLRFEMTREDDSFFMTAIHKKPGGQEQTKSRIDFVLGAGGKADEVYLAWHGDTLWELPMAWMFTLDRWGASHYSPHGSGDFSRESTVRCLECHNTWFEHIPGTLNRYNHEHGFLAGVTCERCHGPGREHVAYHASHPEDDAARKIVQPALLSRERQIEVCTQCHSNFIKHRTRALAYRPGEPLAASYRSVRSKHTEDDHVANQIQYLRESKCFRNSEMTCTTCHNPHRAEQPARSGIESCLACHSQDDCGERPKLPAAVQDNCVACHMPRYIKINVNFMTEDDDYVPPIRRSEHRIEIHPRATQEVLLEWYRGQSDEESGKAATRIAKSLSDEWLAESELCRRDYRFLGAIAAIREAFRIAPAPETRAKLRAAVATLHRIETDYDEAASRLESHDYAGAIELLEGILKLKPNHAKSHGRLGTAYAATGRRDLAVEHLQAVAECDPDDAYGLSMQGWLAFLEDRPRDAAEFYRLADEIEPFSAQINYHWGLSLMKLGSWEEAGQRFTNALDADPNHAGACQGLAHVLRQRGETAEALEYSQRAARLSRYQNSDILLTLADIYADAGQFAAAEKTAAQALESAQKQGSQSVETVRRHIAEIRAQAKRAKK